MPSLDAYKVSERLCSKQRRSHISTQFLSCLGLLQAQPPKLPCKMFMSVFIRLKDAHARFKRYFGFLCLHWPKVPCKMKVKCVILGQKIKPRITHYRHNHELDLDVQYVIPRLMSWPSEKHTTHFLKECSSTLQRDSKNRVFSIYWTNYPKKISLYQAYQQWIITNMIRAFQKCIGDFLWTSVGDFMGP